MFGPASAQPPRLIDFPVLRLPFVELVFVGLLVAVFFVDTQGTDAESGFLAVFVVLPALVFLGIAYLISLPRQRKDITDFRLDAVFVVIGVLGLFGWIGQMLIA